MANEPIEVERISDLAEGQYSDDSWLVIDTGTVVVKLKLKDAVPDASTTVKGKVQLSDSTNNDSSHVAATSKAVKSVMDALTQVSEALSDAISGKYSKPSSGIPKSDLSSAVQTSLENGDNAVAALAEIGKPLVWHGPADVATLNGTISGLAEGWTYTLTDSGILTLGTINVDVGDEVAWTGSVWFKVGGDGGTKVFKVSYSTSINDYVYPTYAEVNAAVQANKVPVILRYIQDSPVRQCFVFKSLSLGYINFENNEMYITLSNSNGVNTGYLSQPNIAPDYESLTFPIIAGEQCLHNGLYYYAKQQIGTSEPWTDAHWTRTSVSEQIGNVEELLAAL